MILWYEKVGREFAGEGLMARPRFDKADPAKRDAILQAAAKEFAHVGYEGASVNRILEGAGLSKGAFYYYFDDKADLACTVLHWVYRDVLAMCDRLPVPEDAATFWEVVHQITCRSLEMLERAPYSNELLSRLGHAFANDRELATRVMDLFAKPNSAVVAIWRRGQELGAVRSDIPVETLIAVFQGIKEALIRAWIPGGRVLTKEEFGRLADLQLDLLRRVSAPALERPR
jgi:AcrR family transcriptional regulator